MKRSLLLSLKTVVFILLMQFSGSALAFTIIEIPESNSAPSSEVTDSTTFNTQIQPVTGAIRTHLKNAKRIGPSRESAQAGSVLASNSHVETMSDADFIKVSSHGGGNDGAHKSLWLNVTSTNFENDFSGTEHDGDQHMLLAGYDLTLSDRYIFGLAFSFETSNVNTEFNLGNQDTDGYSINAYFAYLISDAWSIDFSLGYGEFETDQYRTPTPLLIPITVDSSFDSTRDYISTNLSYTTARGNWYLTGWLGLLLANKDQDDYEESDATEIDGQDIDMELWSLGGEAAYGSGASETYLSLIYENDDDLDEIEFTTGKQPENDDDSLLVSFGWRYYGDELVANIELTSRQGADDVTETAVSTTLRINL